MKDDTVIIMSGKFSKSELEEYAKVIELLKTTDQGLPFRERLEQAGFIRTGSGSLSQLLADSPPVVE